MLVWTFYTYLDIAHILCKCYTLSVKVVKHCWLSLSPVINYIHGYVLSLVTNIIECEYWQSIHFFIHLITELSDQHFQILWSVTDPSSVAIFF